MPATLHGACYLDDTQQINVLDDLKLGQCDACFLLQFLCGLQVPVLAAILQREDQNVALAVDQSFLFLIVSTPKTRCMRQAAQYAHIKHQTLDWASRTASRLSFCAFNCINELMFPHVLGARGVSSKLKQNYCIHPTKYASWMRAGKRAASR